MHIFKHFPGVLPPDPIIFQYPLLSQLEHGASGVPKGGNGGSGPPTFQKVGPQDSHKNVIKLVGGGEFHRSVKKWSLRSLKSKHRMAFQGFAARFCFLRNA